DRGAGVVGAVSRTGARAADGAGPGAGVPPDSAAAARDSGAGARAGGAGPRRALRRGAEFPVSGAGREFPRGARGRVEAQRNLLHPRRRLPGRGDEARADRPDRRGHAGRVRGAARRGVRQGALEHAGGKGTRRTAHRRDDRRERRPYRPRRASAARARDRAAALPRHDDHSLAAPRLSHRGAARLRRRSAPQSRQERHRGVMSPPASAIMSVLSSPEGAGGRDAIDAAVAHELRARFQVERVERRGPRSRLYLGRDLDAGRPIALKVVSRAGASKQAIEAFGTAMAASVALDHPHIIPVYQYGKTRRLFWYSMKWIQGGSLHDTLRDRGPLELTTCQRLVAELAAALYHAHRHGVTHGDVKLTNVMVSADGVALLGDFAVARALSTGSWPLAPGAAADQYALAALTLECLKAGAPADMSLLVPDTVRHALARALSQDPQQRFATVLDFAAVLEKATPALSSPPPTPSPEPPAAPGAKPAVLLWDDAYEQPPVPVALHARRVALGAALVILLAAAAAFGLWLAGRDPAP